MRRKKLGGEVYMTQIILLATSVLLSGCLLLNDVNSVPMLSPSIGETALQPERAIVIYGIGIEGQHKGEPMFGAQLDEYSVERQSITGSCWRYNKMEATVPAIVGTHQYFAFEVSPGFYAARSYLSQLDKMTAFEVPPGHLVYLGDFIWTIEGKVELKRDPEAVRSYFKKDVLLADTRLVPRVPSIICMT